MRKPADCVADAFFDLDFTPRRSIHFIDNVLGNFQTLKALLGNGVFNGL
jgi:hypothetical protein